MKQYIEAFVRQGESISFIDHGGYEFGSESLSVTRSKAFLNKVIVVALSLLLILSTSASFAQLTFQPEKIRKQVLSLEQLLPAYNKTQLPTYLPKAYDTIFNCATVDELYELTNHPNPYVRRSAFGAMLRIETPKAFDLISKNAGDTTQWFYVQTYSNEIKKQTFVDEMLFYLLAYSGWSSRFIMTPAQRETAMEMYENRTIAH